jgi:hypothetical protein
MNTEPPQNWKLMNTEPRTSSRIEKYSHEWTVPAALESTEAKLNALTDYLNDTATFLDRQKETFDKYLRTASESFGPDFYDCHSEEIQRLWVDFPTILASSMLVSACFCLEAGLSDLCKDLDKDSILPKRLTWDNCKTVESKTSGGKSKKAQLKNIQRPMHFLKENFGIDTNVHHHWEALCDLFEVRNCFAHANGDMSLMKTEQTCRIRGAIGRSGDHGIRVLDEDSLHIENKFVKHTLSIMATFWCDLEAALIGNKTIGPRYWP